MGACGLYGGPLLLHDAAMLYIPDAMAHNRESPMRETEGRGIMSVLERMVAGGYEQVVFCTNSEVGLRAIIAIHDTTLGPALGGVRMWPYRTEGEALEDVLRLARGMTYKNALAGLDLGGRR